MAKVLIQSDERAPSDLTIELRDVTELEEIPSSLREEITEGEPYYSGHCPLCGREISDRGDRNDSLEACMIHVDYCEG